MMTAGSCLAVASRKSFISTMAGTAFETLPKNSKAMVRTNFGMRCKINVAEVISPSQPSFCTPGSPDKNLSVTSLPKPTLRKLGPGISRISGSPSMVLPSVSKRDILNRAISIS